MRAHNLVAALLLAAGGCSLLFDGSDLHGRGGAGDDMAVPDDGGGVGPDFAGAPPGSDLSTTPACTPITTVKFTAATPSVAATGPFYIALADVDGDGKPDLVTANYDSNSFSVLLGAGDGSFALAASTPISTCSSPDHIVARDVNGDQKPDLVIECNTQAASNPTTIDVHLNQSTPGMVKFASAKAVTLTMAMQGTLFPVAGNFDADTHVDLALVGNNGVYFFAGDGAGGFTAGATVAAGMGADAAVAGNLNGDAVDDLIVYNDGDDDMTMLTSKAGGGFTATRLAWDTTGASNNGTIGGTLYFGGTPTLSDVDGDTLYDIVITSGTSTPGQVMIFKNAGSSTAPSFPDVVGKSISVFDFPVPVALADFTCDGKLDIATATPGCTQGDPNCQVGEPSQLAILPGHGTGFDAAQLTPVLKYCDNLVVGDFDGNGYNDLACGSGAGTINVLLNKP